jgi:DNA-binding transcriptional LysR family regulator
MQDLSRIRAFVQVFEAGGFSAAARQHGRSKALLSKYVTELEDHLGVRLMNRTTRKLSLTEAGSAYYREVSDILAQLDALDASVADDSAAPRGLLRIAAPRNFGESSLSPALFAFMQAHPDVTLDLRLEDRFVDLVEEGIDLALRISAMSDSSLIARKISEMEMSVCAAPSLIAKLGAPAHPEDLRNLPCIVDTNVKGMASWRFETADGVVSVSVDGPVRVNSPLAALAAAAAGLGFASLPSYLAKEAIISGSVVPVLRDAGRGSMSLHAVYPHRRHLAGKVRALIDHLVAWYEENPVH